MNTLKQDGDSNMEQANKNPEITPEKTNESLSLLEQVTPLARKINCLDIDRVADVCITNIPKLTRTFVLLADKPTSVIRFLIRLTNWRMVNFPARR